MKKLAIIGSSVYQRPLYLAARKMGLFIIGFSCDMGSVREEEVDKFYYISIINKEEILSICQTENVAGVVGNGSMLTVEVANYISEKLHLDCTPYEVINNLKDKAYVRKIAQGIENLSEIKSYIYSDGPVKFLPCVVKPSRGTSKFGVSFAETQDDFQHALEYSKIADNSPIIVEEFIAGQEISVETISFRGKHFIIQITDKDSTGAPHFVELAHHQPSLLPSSLQSKIKKIVCELLDKVGFITGATHIEFKISKDEKVYLIEINPRGGGDYISTDLIPLSTGYNYCKGLVECAIGNFSMPEIIGSRYSGVYFLTKQTSHLTQFFKNAFNKPWFVRGHVDSYDLQECVGNAYKNGYIIYQAGQKILPD